MMSIPIMQAAASRTRRATPKRTELSKSNARANTDAEVRGAATQCGAASGALMIFVCGLVAADIVLASLLGSSRRRLHLTRARHTRSRALNRQELCQQRARGGCATRQRPDA